MKERGCDFYVFFPTTVYNNEACVNKPNVFLCYHLLNPFGGSGGGTGARDPPESGRAGEFDFCGACLGGGGATEDFESTVC